MSDSKNQPGKNRSAPELLDNENVREAVHALTSLINSAFGKSGQSRDEAMGLLAEKLSPSLYREFHSVAQEIAFLQQAGKSASEDPEVRKRLNDLLAGKAFNTACQELLIELIQKAERENRARPQDGPLLH